MLIGDMKRAAAILRARRRRRRDGRDRAFPRRALHIWPLRHALRSPSLAHMAAEEPPGHFTARREYASAS